MAGHAPACNGVEFAGQLGKQAVLQGNVLQERIARNGLQAALVNDGQHAVDKGRNVVRVAKYQHHLQAFFADKLLQNLVENLACGGIQPDVGIVYDEQLWLGKQGLGHLQLAHLSARQINEPFLQQAFNLETAEKLAGAFGFVLAQ